MKSVFTKLTLNDVREETSSEGGLTLRRTITANQLVSLGIGGIIGAGIFVYTGQVANLHAGPAAVLSFLIAGLVCIPNALCYAELSSTVPVSGSAYKYAYMTLGEIVAWIIGWDLLLEYLFGVSAVAKGWSKYIVGLLSSYHISLPTAITSEYDVPAVLIIMLLGGLMCLGVRESARVNNVLVLVKLVVIAAFLIACAPHFSTANWHGHFIPPNTGKFGEFGWSGVLAGASVAFFAFIGFDALSTASQEVRDPRRSMPIGIVGSLLICTFLYMAVAFVLTGVVPYDQLNGADPIAIGIHATGNLWLETFVRLGALAGLTSVILVLLLGQSRILASMATDGLLWRKVGALHPRYRTPYIATLFTMGFSSVIAACVPSDLLGDMVCIGTLFAFIIVCVGVMILRHTEPDLDRPFKVPAVYVVAPLGIISCLLLVVGLSTIAQIRFVIWLVVGLIVYFAYGYHHSRVRRVNGN